MQNKQKRLAVIDTKFPWMHSGFRYWENYFLKELRPDTIFFATEQHTDPFPSKVHSLGQFEEVVVSQGITDVYCVFLNLALSLVGENTLESGRKMPGSNSLWCIKQIIDKHALRLHTTLYPGGGLDPNTPDY